MTPTEIRALRLALKLTPQTFAVKVGVGQATVYRWESGESKPRGLALKRLASMARRLEGRSR